MADITYDTERRRWVIKGEDGLPKEYISDAQSLFSLKKGFVGTTPAIGIGTLGGCGIATMTGVPAGIAVADKIFVTPKNFLTLGLAAPRIPAADTVNIIFYNGTNAVATQPAVGWDCVVMRNE